MSKKGISAKIEFMKQELTDMFGDRERRTLEIEIKVTGDLSKYTKEEIAEIRSNLEYKTVEYLKENYLHEPFIMGCPWSEEEDNKYIIGDCFSVPYEHGYMGEIKEDIKEAFKIIKKQMEV